MGAQLELAGETAAPDPDGWGLSPAAIEAQQRAMSLGGGGEVR